MMHLSKLGCSFIHLFKMCETFAIPVFEDLVGSQP